MQMQSHNSILHLHFGMNNWDNETLKQIIQFPFDFAFNIMHRHPKSADEKYIFSDHLQRLDGQRLLIKAAEAIKQFQTLAPLHVGKLKTRLKPKQLSSETFSN